MTHPTPDTDDKPGFSATADRLEHLADTMSTTVDRYATLLASTAPGRPNPLDLAASIRHLNQLVDELTSTLSERNIRISRLVGAHYEIDLHRESVLEMQCNLRTIPRWHWIRRNRIRHQLALIAISITARVTRSPELRNDQSPAKGA